MLNRHHSLHGGSVSRFMTRSSSTRSIVWTVVFVPPPIMLLNGCTVGPLDLAGWWWILQDPALDSLIHRALESNLDLATAAAKIREARAQRRVITAGASPELATSAGYTHSQRSDNTANATATSGDAADLFQAGFDAGWELDLFGGVRRAVQAADAAGPLRAAGRIRANIEIQTARQDQALETYERIGPYHRFGQFE